MLDELNFPGLGFCLCLEPPSLFIQLCNALAKPSLLTDQRRKEVRPRLAPPTDDGGSSDEGSLAVVLS